MTYLAKFAFAVTAFAIAVGGVPTSASAGDYFNGFEVNDDNWFGVTRVPSGTNGIPSASGGFHAEAPPDAFTRWGGYNDDPACAGGGSCVGTFPALGFDTAVDIYLDVDGGYGNDKRFDFSSAISQPDGAHRRDFMFNCGFYDDAATPGTGNRFVCSASNNSPGFPKNPGREPTVVATTSGWYTFLHQFRDNGSGVLTVDLSVLDSGGTVIKTWTLSDPSDVIGSTVGGNRYGWHIPQQPANLQFGTLAIDNSRRNSVSPSSLLDHFACYKVSENTKLPNEIVTLEDQFGFQDNVKVEKAKMLCVPVSKNGEEIINAKIHLTCYDTKSKQKSPKLDVLVTHQLGEQELAVKKPDLLCLPSLKTVLGPSVGKDHDEDDEDDD